jgi:hypothetical protein
MPLIRTCAWLPSPSVANISTAVRRAPRPVAAPPPSNPHKSLLLLLLLLLLLPPLLILLQRVM